jgi:hypothetical protein
MHMIKVSYGIVLTGLLFTQSVVAQQAEQKFSVYRSYKEMHEAKDVAPVVPEALTTAPGGHFFGYYDKFETDPSGRYVLGQQISFEHRLPQAGEAIKIGMVDTQDSNTWIELGISRAWSWQQGCMLQWRPGSATEVLWNDLENGAFVCRVYDIKTKKMRTLPRAIGHVSSDGKKAVCEDFSRIWDCRAGYGYPGVPDKLAAQPAPAEEGIWKMDLDTGEVKLLFSFADAVKATYENQKPTDKHYINHLQWSPDNKRFLFFDRWLTGPGMPTRVFTLGADGKDLRLLSKMGASHYIWRDNESVLIWGLEENGYTIYKDDNDGKADGVLWKAPNGHQLFIPGTDNQWLVADSYARELYLYHVPTARFVFLGRYPQDKAYKGEWRCDLHPRVSRDGKAIFFDSPHAGNMRQIYRIQIGHVIASNLTE